MSTTSNRFEHRVDQRRPKGVGRRFFYKEFFCQYLVLGIVDNHDEPRLDHVAITFHEGGDLFEIGLPPIRLAKFRKPLYHRLGGSMKRLGSCYPPGDLLFEPCQQINPEPSHRQKLATSPFYDPQDRQSSYQTGSGG